MPKFRHIKLTAAQILTSERWETELEQFAAIELVSPLFALLLHKNQTIRWRTIESLGTTTARLVKEINLEAGRNIMRRFMWHMNEESGNIGWGIPEAMATTMVAQKQLSIEFHKKLASYIQTQKTVGDTNYIDHPPLRECVYWALARLAQKRPQHVLHAQKNIIEALKEDSHQSKACAILALEFIKCKNLKQLLKPFKNDHTRITIYINKQFTKTTLAELATQSSPMDIS